MVRVNETWDSKLVLEQCVQFNSVGPNRYWNMLPDLTKSVVKLTCSPKSFYWAHSGMGSVSIPGRGWCWSLISMWAISVRKRYRRFTSWRLNSSPSFASCRAAAAHLLPVASQILIIISSPASVNGRLTGSAAGCGVLCEDKNWLIVWPFKRIWHRAGKLSARRWQVSWGMSCQRRSTRAARGSSAYIPDWSRRLMIDEICLIGLRSQLAGSQPPRNTTWRSSSHTAARAVCAPSCIKSHLFKTYRVSIFSTMPDWSMFEANTGASTPWEQRTSSYLQSALMAPKNTTPFWNLVWGAYTLGPHSPRRT